MNTIYSVYYNPDQIEGSGPMVLDISFTTRSDAEKYMDTKPGAMGLRAKWREELFGDWVIRETLLLDSISEAREVEIAKAIQRAMAKLTLGERKLLGLP